jgi:hypothetical protein
MFRTTFGSVVRCLRWQIVCVTLVWLSCVAQAQVPEIPRLAIVSGGQL